MLFFDDIINIENFNQNNFKLDVKSYRNTLDMRQLKKA